jgi:hypothetical protein
MNAETRQKAFGFARTYWSDAVYLSCSLALLAWVTWDAIYARSITWKSGSDYWEHSAVLRAWIQNLANPEHPMIGGEVSSPRFSPHFLIVAILARLLGVDAIGAMSIAEVLNTALLLVGIYVFFRTYFRTRLASLFGLFVMFGSWWDAPHFSNVYKLDVYFSVAGYPSNATLAVTLIAFTIALIALRSARERRGLLALLAVLFGYIYITHPLTAMMSLTGALILAAVEPGVPRRRRLWVGGTVVAGLLLSAIWPYYPAIRMVTGGTVDRVSNDIEQGSFTLHPFYAPDLMFDIVGFAIVGVALIPYFLIKRKQLFLALGPLPLLAVFLANAFVQLPLGHRFILLATFYFQASLVWLLLRLVARDTLSAAWWKAPALRAIVACAIGIFFVYITYDNVADAQKRFTRGMLVRESPTVRFGRRVAELVGPNAVVLADKLTSWSLPTFGTHVVAFHHRNPLVPDALERNAAVARFLGSGSDETRETILRRYKVTHVIVSGKRGSADRFLSERATLQPLPGGSRLYKLHGS